MTFYEALTPYYDQIFPANPKQLGFLSSLFAKDGRLLDVGAGTGNMAASLVEQGYTVLAAEPDGKM
ncbi:SAM-dependent methyltransferase, partial [Neobacillus drentensis]